MTGMRSEKFKFACPLCHAGVGKPCVEIQGPRKGKTCQAHGIRWTKYKRATTPRKQVKAVLYSQFESNRGKH